MTLAKDVDVGTTAAPGATTAAPQVQLGLRLHPVDHSDQPVFANFTMVQGAPGMVFLDFGFLEPSALPGIARLAQTGGKMPEAINGRLACRIALGADVAAQLAQQLMQHLKGAHGAVSAATKLS